MILKEIARRIFQQTLASMDIAASMERKLDRQGTRIHCEGATVNLAEFDRIVTIACGKAAEPMARGLLSVLAPDFPTGGILSAPVRLQREMPGFEAFAAGHPVPNEASLAAGAAALHVLSECDEKSLVFLLLSGGGSALMEQPLEPGIYLEDIQALNRLLVTCGAPIEQVNAVRKHLSAVKGGRLAAAAPRSMKITLGVTDVPAGRESALASGPTLPDPTTVDDAYRVVAEYRLLERLPPSIRAVFQARALQETPKPGDSAFARNHFQILLGMPDLFHAAHHASEAAGFLTICDNTTDDWPLERAADVLLQLLADWKRENPARPVCVIADGEVSSAVTGNGVGGRNSAFVLDCVPRIAGKPICVLSAGTDGADGNSPAAGAVADGTSFQRARAAGHDPADFFRASDAYTFFKSLGDAVETGPTGNNLRDLRILLRT